MRRALWALCLLVSCGHSTTQDLALEEPLRFGYNVGAAAYPAQFYAGDLPAPGGGPAVVGVDVGPTEAAPGDVGKNGYTVRLDRKAFSVAMRLQGRTNGYWIARVDQVETLFDNQVSASLFFDVAPAVSPGRYQIELSGIDGDGKYGVRTTAPVLVVPRIPVNAPVVMTLHWDTAMDLDLQLKSPDGTLLSSKHPLTVATTATDVGTVAGVGYLQGDSLGACIDDGYREEDVVFTTSPNPGTYSIYVNPFSLCGKLGTTYEVTVTRAGVVTNRWAGRIAAPEVQAGGYQLGDFISDVSLP